MNLTPDSFSDGGKLQSPNSVKLKFHELLAWADVIDIGAESTAPFNCSIDPLEEFKRFEKFLFPALQNIKDPQTTISIDTYRPEVFYEIYHVLKFYWPDSRVIFNDVSGKIDKDLVDLLSENLDFEYVYCHNLCPGRDQTSDHMQYCENIQQSDFIQYLANYFCNALKVLKPLNRKIWIDPCFGFSKTKEQNLLLLNNFQKFSMHLPKDSSILYGISRKSFLRVPQDMNPKDLENQKILDQMQAIAFYDLIRSRLSNPFLFRVHDSSSLKSALKMDTILS